MAKKFTTKAGMEALELSLQDALASARAISKEVGEAAGSSHDWHDNFEYEDAQRRLAQAQKTLEDLKETISECQVVEPERQSDRVQIGNRVEILIDDEELTFIVVGFGESAPKQGRIAYDTPLGAALMGREVGDDFEANVGPRKRSIEILNIYPPVETDGSARGSEA